MAEPRKWTICLGCGKLVGVWEDEEDCGCAPGDTPDNWVQVVELRDSQETK